MKSNNYKIILVVVLLAAVLFARLYKGQVHRMSEASYSADHQTIIDPNAYLIYTKHARCRMDCRHISEDDIREVLREGHINEVKSQQNESPCPTYAIEEDRHKDGVRLRIVFAKCDRETKVVTCIDRDHEYECDCK
jgi:hypothetical protein